MGDCAVLEDVDGVLVRGAVAGIIVCDWDFFFGDAVLFVGCLEAIGSGGGEVVNWEAGDCWQGIGSCPVGAEDVAS